MITKFQEEKLGFLSPLPSLLSPFSLSLSLFPQTQHAPRRSYVSKQQEGSCLQPKEKGLTRHQPCWHLGLGLSAPRTVRDQFLLGEPPRPPYLVRATQAKTEGNRKLLVSMYKLNQKRAVHILFMTTNVSKARGVSSGCLGTETPGGRRFGGGNCCLLQAF